MKHPYKQILTFLLAITLFGTNLASVEDWLSEEIESTCNSDDLNHSKLVECKLAQCLDDDDDDDDATPNLLSLERDDKFLHIISSRSGDRFVSNVLDSLNLIETDYEKSMDINTTLYVDTKGKQHRKTYGFGTTINFGSLSRNVDHISARSILKQIFSQGKNVSGGGGLRLSLLRVSISREKLTRGEIMNVLNKVDDLLSKALGDGTKVKLILSFEYWPKNPVEDIQATLKDIQGLDSISLDGLKSLECWAVSMPYLPTGGIFAEGLRDFIGEFCSGTKNIFSEIPMHEAAKHVKQLSNIRGVLVQSDFESTYGNLDQVFSMRDNLTVITIGSPKSLDGDYGNWQTAHHHAVEIMNHLKHDSSGFVETQSVIDVLSDSQQTNGRDGSIYSLGPKYDSYFKGPIFYAMGHFSKYLPSGSRRLDTELATQPNMFAAEFMAFITPQKHVVTIVLNDNEHDLPFRLAIDKRIRAHVMLKSKSFNTFVIKL